MRGTLIGVMGTVVLLGVGGWAPLPSRTERGGAAGLPRPAAIAPAPPRGAPDATSDDACGRRGHEALGRLLARRGVRPTAPPVTLTAGYHAAPCTVDVAADADPQQPRP